MREREPSKSSRQSGRCPTCDGPVESTGSYRPFCRERCKMVDLGRWFQGEYVVAGEDAIALDPEFIENELRRLAELSLEAKRKVEQSRDPQSEGSDEEGGSPGSED